MNGTPSSTRSHQERRGWLEKSQQFERHLGAQAGLMDEGHLRHVTGLPSLEEVAVGSNTQ